MILRYGGGHIPGSHVGERPDKDVQAATSYHSPASVNVHIQTAPVKAL